MENADEELSFLLRSDNRREILIALAERGPLDRHEIRDALDASRRTVSRVLKTLVEAGYVRNLGNRYRLTAFGAFQVDTFRDWAERAAITDRFRPFLANVDDDLFDPEPGLLRSASLTVATDLHPHAPMDRLLAIREGASQIRSVTPIVRNRCLTHVAKRCRRGDQFEAEVVVPAEMVERVDSLTGHDSTLRTIRASESVSSFVHPGPLRVLCSVVDDTAVFGAYVDAQLHALVESDAHEFRELATERIDACRTEAVQAEESAN